MSTELEDKYERKRGGARQRGVYLAPKKTECSICHKALCNMSRHMKEVHKIGKVTEDDSADDSEEEEEVQQPQKSKSSVVVATKVTASAAKEKEIEPKVADNDEATPNKQYKSPGKQCPYCLKDFQRVNRHIRDNCHVAPANDDADADDADE